MLCYGIGIPMWLVLNTLFILKSIVLLVFICIFKLKSVKTSSDDVMMMGLIIFKRQIKNQTGKIQKTLDLR